MVPWSASLSSRKPLTALPNRLANQATSLPSPEAPIIIKSFDSDTVPLNLGMVTVSLLLIPSRTNTFLRSEEHTSELQSRPHLVCCLLLEKKINHHYLPLIH